MRKLAMLAKNLATELSVIDVRAARVIRQELNGSPKQCIIDFVLDAANSDCTIEFERCDGLIIGHDEVVGQMWKDVASDDPTQQAFGQLVARSLLIDLIGDGR